MLLCAAALPASQGGAARATADAARLPDLDQELPWGFQVTSVERNPACECRLDESRDRMAWPRLRST